MFNLAGNTLTSTNYYYNDANELTKTNVEDGEFTRYEYDANGNRVAKIQPENVVTRYTWDYENRLTNVLMHQGKFVDYEYDGDGNRIGKIAGVKKPLMKDKPNEGKVNKQQADIIYNASNNGNDGNSSNAGGNGNDKDDPDGDKNGKGKDKTNNGKDSDKVKNKDLSKEDRNKKKENAKQGKGYRQKGKYNNKGKHLGWYKNKNKLDQQLEETYYLNDVSSDLSQVMMTYDETGMFDTAYTYGDERIGIDILDGTRPDAQNPLYYLYDGQGSVTYVTKPDGEKRDTYNYDEFGKPRTGKLSPDGDKILHTSFGYNGEQWDEESKLQYLRARYYEPETGRFLSRDTYEGELANPLSKHLYAYVHNNPVNFKDPSGHFAESWWDAISLAGSIAMFVADRSFINGVAVIYDSFALITPGLPGGAGYLIKAVKSGKLAGKLASLVKKIVAVSNKVFNKIAKYIPSKYKTHITNIIKDFKNWVNKKLPKGGPPKGSGNVIKTKSGFQLTAHALEQLGEARFKGKLSLVRLDQLMHSKNAIRVIDNRTGNINIFVNSEFSSSSLLRITVPRDGKRIVSIGFEGLKKILKFISSGDFTKIK